jgi:hypothetical protein
LVDAYLAHFPPAQRHPEGANPFEMLHICALKIPGEIRLIFKPRWWIGNGYLHNFVLTRNTVFKGAFRCFTNLYDNNTAAFTAPICSKKR